MLKNKVQLIGNVGNDPEILNLDSGSKVAKLSIATNETYKNKQGEKVTDTQWHNLVAWRKTADLIESYVNKGDQIAIEGKLTSRSYDDKEGNKRYVTEVVVNEVLFLGGKSNNQSNSNEGSKTMKEEAAIYEDKEEELDDLPF